MASADQIKKPKMDRKEFERVARHIAAQMGDEKLIDDINMDGQYALYVASSNGLMPRPLANDKRFPNTNYAANCWTAVNEYQYCVKVTGSHFDSKCVQRKADFMELCPAEWLENWQDQIEDGTFMGIGDTLGPGELDEEEEEEEEEAGSDGEESDSEGDDE